VKKSPRSSPYFAVGSVVGVGSRAQNAEPVFYDLIGVIGIKIQVCSLSAMAEAEKMMGAKKKNVHVI
jgi:hypothetical protein